jgi:hypothetical protein
MSTVLMGSILDGSIAGLGIMAAVMLFIAALATAEPRSTVDEAEGPTALPRVKKAA